MAYLEDYKMDPHSATPLLTFSVFDDYSKSHNLTLVRGDILNKNIPDSEGLQIVQSVVDNYKDEYGMIQTFNERPNSFDVDDYISRMNTKWTTTNTSTSMPPPASPDSSSPPRPPTV